MRFKGPENSPRQNAADLRSSRAILNYDNSARDPRVDTSAQNRHEQRVPTNRFPDRAVNFLLPVGDLDDLPDNPNKDELAGAVIDKLAQRHSSIGDWLDGKKSLTDPELQQIQETIRDQQQRLDASADQLTNGARVGAMIFSRDVERRFNHPLAQVRGFEGQSHYRVNTLGGMKTRVNFLGGDGDQKPTQPTSPPAEVDKPFIVKKEDPEVGMGIYGNDGKPLSDEELKEKGILQQ